MHNNKQIRSIHFDLDVNELKKYYPKKYYLADRVITSAFIV